MTRVRGERAVRAALVAAGAELFAARGVSTVSVREIAERAGVNHGLVHHYFDSKDGLLAAILHDLARRSAADVDDSAALYATGDAASRHGRIVASLLLEARDPAAVQTEFPTIAALVARLEREGRADARERAAQAAAFVLGWKLYEPFIAAATGLDVSDGTRTAILDRALTRLLE
ncbi:MAG: helix-turn-helix domain-containing protein [Actinomycetota bacterium]